MDIIVYYRIWPTVCISVGTTYPRSSARVLFVRVCMNKLILKIVLSSCENIGIHLCSDY